MEHVLYLLASADPIPSATPAAARATLRAAEEALVATAKRVSPTRAKNVRVHFESSPMRALAKLRSGSVDAFVVDARAERGSLDESSALGVLKSLFPSHDLARVLSNDKVALVVDGTARSSALAFEAGRMHLGGVVATSSANDWEPVWERIVSIVARGRGGKIAVCLAGGGTEGLLYELGVLRAIDRFLPATSTADVDILCGISAGAILGGLLANGVRPDVLAQGLKSGNERVLPLRRSDLFDLNVKDFAKRAARLSWEVVRGKRSPVSALFRLPPAGVFAGARLGDWLDRQFDQPGMISTFDRLPRKLFIGATDQDSSEHVLFGSPAAPNVPIPIAIRASTALAPFYAPEKIGDRYYVDGGFTRTTNMRVAVQEGATLVILVDPMVPIRSHHPGHVNERGAIYGAMQGLKSLINGRFDKAVPTLRAMYPHVAFHLFQPGPDARRVMAGSPMKYFFREEIEEIAYRETMREIRSTRLEIMRRDFDRHGVEFVDPDVRPSSEATSMIGGEVVA